MRSLTSKESHRQPGHGGNLRSIDFVTKPRLIWSPVTFKKRELKSKMCGCSAPTSRGQKQPKFGLPESTKTKQLIPVFGHFIAESKTGNSMLVGSQHQTTLTNSSKMPWPLIMMMMIISFSLLFASSLQSITIASHNLHGFKKSSIYHKSCLQSLNGIWMGQELWLSEKQLSSLHQLDTQFVARSGMEDSISQGIYRGRPHGGVSISWSSMLNHLISPLTHFRHKRVVGIELKTKEQPFLVICVYMPFFNASQRAECVSETIDAISMMETMIAEYPNHSVIIGGDLNTEMKGDSPLDPYWDSFLEKFQLTSCDSLFPADSFTYHHESLNQKKWNDHFIASKSIFENNVLTDPQILSHGDNPSDHLPITMSLSAELQDSLEEQSEAIRDPTLKWEKLSEE